MTKCKQQPVTLPHLKGFPTDSLNSMPKVVEFQNDKYMLEGDYQYNLRIEKSVTNSTSIIPSRDIHDIRKNERNQQKLDPNISVVRKVHRYNKNSDEGGEFPNIGQLGCFQYFKKRLNICSATDRDSMLIVAELIGRFMTLSRSLGMRALVWS